MGVIVLVTAAALVIAILFAHHPSLTRLMTLWTGAAYQEDGRIFLVSRSWPIVKSFPLWGTGYGTFRYLEPLYLHTLQEVGRSYDHAHNEYLEGLIEGGVLRLSMTVLAMALVYRLGLRCWQHITIKRRRRWAWGRFFLLRPWRFTVLANSAFTSHQSHCCRRSLPPCCAGCTMLSAMANPQPPGSCGVGAWLPRGRRDLPAVGALARLGRLAAGGSNRCGTSLPRGRRHGTIGGVSTEVPESRSGT